MASTFTTFSPNTRIEILTQLTETLTAIQNKMRDVSADNFMAKTTQNWTKGQHISHLNRSFEPFIVLLKVPKFMLKFFGSPSRKSLSFQEIQDKYLQHIEKGIAPTPRFAPHQVLAEDKWKLLAEFAYHKNELLELLENWTEIDLDSYMIPHPFLGKLTIREMLFFMIAHVEKNKLVME